MDNRLKNALKVIAEEFPDYVMIGINLMDVESVSYSVGINDVKNLSNAKRIKTMIAELEVLKSDLLEFLKDDNGEILKG